MEKKYKKNKGGRPELQENQKQKHRLVCYLKSEENEIYLQFKNMNIGNNSFHLKNALFSYMGNDKHQVKKLNKEVLKMMGNLNRVANLFNQTTHHLNKGLKLDGSKTIQFMKDYKAILQILTEIKNEITK